MAKKTLTRRINAPHRPAVRILTLKQFAELCGVSLSTIRRAIGDGRLSIIRLSERRIGIREDDAATFQQSYVEAAS